MIGSFVTRGLIMVLGYIYPAYDCFKSLEHGRTKEEQLRFWCQYWVIIAVITASEKVADPFIGWLPLYCEAKLALIVYLWHPRTKGAIHIYRDYLLPFVLRHEPDVDRRLAEFRCRSTDVIARYWGDGIAFGQQMLMEGLQYVAAQAPANQLHTSPNQGYGGLHPVQRQGPIIEEIPSENERHTGGVGEWDSRPTGSAQRSHGRSGEEYDIDFEEYSMVDSDAMPEVRRRQNVEYGGNLEQSSGYMSKLRSATSRKRSDPVPLPKKSGRF